MTIAGVFFLGVVLWSAADSAPVLPPIDREALMKMSEEERKAFLEEYDRKLLQLQEQNEKAARERQAALDARRKQAAQEEEEAARRAKAAARYEIDPLLKKAYEMFMDFAHRDREQVVATFEEYLRRNPDSVFRAQVYHCMGVMYAGNVNRNHGETIDLGKMRAYYQKAHEAFGGRFSIDAMLVYDKLAFLGGTLEDRLGFYDWLRAVQEKGTPADLYPIRGIATCISGFAPEYTPANLDRMWMHIQTDFLPQEIRATEQQLFRGAFQPGRSAYMDLSIFAKRYPQTELGRQARHALEQMHEKMGLSVLEFDINDIGAESPSVQTAGLQETPEAKMLGETTAPRQEPRSDGQGGKSMSLPAGVAGVVLVALVVLGIWSRKRRQDCTHTS
jgi:hypothetical protein